MAWTRGIFGGLTGRGEGWDEAKVQQRARQLAHEYLPEKNPAEKKLLGDELLDAAITADRPDFAEIVVAGGKPESERINAPQRAERAPLFFSRSGARIKEMTSAELAPPPSPDLARSLATGASAF